MSNGRGSQTFLAFDLEDVMTLKAYFLPTLRAEQSGQSNLSVFSRAIRNLPQQNGTSFPALDALLMLPRTRTHLFSSKERSLELIV